MHSATEKHPNKYNSEAEREERAQRTCRASRDEAGGFRGFRRASAEGRKKEFLRSRDGMEVSYAAVANGMGWKEAARSAMESCMAYMYRCCCCCT